MCWIFMPFFFFLSLMALLFHTQLWEFRTGIIQTVTLWICGMATMCCTVMLVLLEIWFSHRFYTFSHVVLMLVLLSKRFASVR